MTRVKHVSDSDNGHAEEGVVVVHQVTGDLGQYPRMPGPPPPPWDNSRHNWAGERP